MGFTAFRDINRGEMAGILMLSISQAPIAQLISGSLELEFLDFLLPPLSLQPLVENAVRYGITKKGAGGTVTIKSRVQDNQILVTITDDGVGFDMAVPKEDGRSHTGIENVRSRLKLQCGGSLEIKSKPGVGTEVRIALPGKEDTA